MKKNEFLLNVLKICIKKAQKISKTKRLAV